MKIEYKVAIQEENGAMLVASKDNQVAAFHKRATRRELAMFDNVDQARVVLDDVKNRTIFLNSKKLKVNNLILRVVKVKLVTITREYMVVTG